MYTNVATALRRLQRIQRGQPPLEHWYILVGHGFSHDVIDSVEYRQLSDGASCLYLRLCQATNVDFREERKGKWKYVLGQTTARRETEMWQQLCGHEKRKVVRGWLQDLMEIGLIERLVDSEGRLACLVRG